MTKTQRYLDSLPKDIQDKFTPLFGNMQTFYQAMYFIAQNEHYLELHKDENTVKNLDIIHMIHFKVKRIIKGFGLDGKRVLADIQQEYMEDQRYNRVQESPLADQRFIEIVQHISTL